MTRRLGLFALAALICLLTNGLSAPAMAQNGGGGGGSKSGGSGGGGIARHGGRSNVIWDVLQSINGRTPKASGAVNISTYVATLNLDVRVSSVNLPDATPLTVTVYVKDYFTGQPLPSKVAGTISLSAQSGSLAVLALWSTTPGYLPAVTQIVVTQPDGSVVMSGHI